MTDEQIKKALECCSLIQGECKECPCDSVMDCDCEEMLLREAFYLINRKDAEVERLNVELVGMRGACESYKIHYDNAQAEIERLKAEIRKTDNALTKLDRPLMEVKSEAYKEFAERLYQNCKKYPYTLPYVFTNIEITLKELTEGGNEDE